MAGLPLTSSAGTPILRAEDSAYLSTARSESRPIGSTSSQPMARPSPGHNLRRAGICTQVN